MWLAAAASGSAGGRYYSGCVQYTFRTDGDSVCGRYRLAWAPSGSNTSCLCGCGTMANATLLVDGALGLGSLYQAPLASLQGALIASVVVLALTALWMVSSNKDDFAQLPGPPPSSWLLGHLPQVRNCCITPGCQCQREHPLAAPHRSRLPPLPAAAGNNPAGCPSCATTGQCPGCAPLFPRKCAGAQACRGLLCATASMNGLHPRYASNPPNHLQPACSDMVPRASSNFVSPTFEWLWCLTQCSFRCAAHSGECSCHSTACATAAPPTLPSRSSTAFLRPPGSGQPGERAAQGS